MNIASKTIELISANDENTAQPFVPTFFFSEKRAAHRSITVDHFPEHLGKCQKVTFLLCLSLVTENFEACERRNKK